MTRRYERSWWAVQTQAVMAARVVHYVSHTPTDHGAVLACGRYASLATLRPKLTADVTCDDCRSAVTRAA